MDKSVITVTMPVTEYERLQNLEQAHQKWVGMFERANVNGVATMTSELRTTIEEIYC